MAPTFTLAQQLVLTFLILGTSTPKAEVSRSQCEQCLVTIRRGNKVTKTLVYHSHYNCKEQTTSCVHNTTSYEICPNNGSPICFNPQGSQFVLDIEITGYQGQKKPGIYLGRNHSTSRSPEAQICFDACYAIAQGQGGGGVLCGPVHRQQSYVTMEKYIYHTCSTPPSSGTFGDVSNSVGSAYWYTQNSAPRSGPPLGNCYDGPSWFNISRRAAASNCQNFKCNPLCLLFNAPPPGTLKVGLGIDGTGTDPYGQIEIKITKTVHQPQRFTLFHSFYEEMETKMDIPSVTKNLFIDLAERVVSSLNVTNCYVCGGTNMGELWPWESREVNLTTLYQMNLTWSSVNRPREWNLKTSITSNTCFHRTSSQFFTVPLGDLVCQNVLAANDSTTWWSGTNGSRPDNPFSSYKQLSSIWDRLHDASLSWPAPDGLFWICGKKAYVSLPEKWSGTCALGTINPSFFLLPIAPGERLGVQMSNKIGQRQKRSLQITSQKTWGNDDWLTERSMQVYGPATWAEDGMNGYRTPIYLPNHLIRLQADIESVTNAMSTAHELLAESPNTQIPTAVYQKRLASDYLLAQEDGVCRTCYPSKCCLKIDDTSKTIKEITDNMMKIAHVPVQTWNGAVDFNSFGGIFSGWKRIGFLVLLALEVSSSPVSLH